MKWEVRETREVEAGGKPAIQRHIVGVVDNSGCPEIEVNISMSLTLPKETDGPVPVLMSFGWTPFEPSPFNFGRRGGGPCASLEGRPADRGRLGMCDAESFDRAGRRGWLAADTVRP